MRKDEPMKHWRRINELLRKQELLFYYRIQKAEREAKRYGEVRN